MPHTTVVLEEAGIIEVVTTGHITRQEMGDNLAKIVELRLFHSLQRVLVDVRNAESMPSTMPMFEFANAVASQKVLQDVRFALLRHADSPEDLDFLETASRNRGVQMQIFDQRDDALVWLARE